jgi:hypothetical protein
MHLEVKNSAAESAAWAGAFVMKDPVFLNDWTNPHYPFSESLKNFCVVMLIGCLSSRNPLFVNNTHGIKETHKHAFHF